MGLLLESLFRGEGAHTHTHTHTLVPYLTFAAALLFSAHETGDFSLFQLSVHKIEKIHWTAIFRNLYAKEVF